MSQALAFGRQLQAHHQMKVALLVALLVEAGQASSLDQSVQSGRIDPIREDEQVPRLGQGLDSAEHLKFLLHLVAS